MISVLKVKKVMFMLKLDRIFQLFKYTGLINSSKERAAMLTHSPISFKGQRDYASKALSAAHAFSLI